MNMDSPSHRSVWFRFDMNGKEFLMTGSRGRAGTPHRYSVDIQVLQRKTPGNPDHVHVLSFVAHQYKNSQMIDYSISWKSTKSQQWWQDLADSISVEELLEHKLIEEEADYAARQRDN